MGETAAAVRGSANRTFRAATSWQQRSPGRFDGEIDPVWSQGRAIYGGIVGAGMARAMRHAVPADQRKVLRSISVSFAAAVDAGAVTCTTGIAREGRSASFVEAEVIQSDATRATASGVYGRSRPSSLRVPGPPRPDAPSPDDLDAMPYLEGLTPRFTQRFEFRWTRGGYPYSGSTLDGLAGWVRFRHESDPADEAGLLALIDSWPSPAISSLRTPAPASSITWNVDFAALRPDLRVDEWWYFDAITSFAGDGYSSFDASLWAPDGQFVARSRQLVGIFERPAAG